MDPQLFLDSAVAMAANTQEINCRNAISRAYYAAYHCAISSFDELHNRSKHSTEPGGVHKRFFNELLKADAGSIERNIGFKLKTLYGRRVIADYKLDEIVVSRDVAIQIDGTRSAMQLCHQTFEGGSTT